MARVERETKETRIVADVTVPGSGTTDVQLTGALAGSEPGAAGAGAASGRAAFAEHMLITLAKWSGFDVTVRAESKDGLEHHLVEDAAIGLAQAFRESVDTSRITRVGHAVVPMDDACVMVAVDLVNRPYYGGELPDALMDHVFRSFATEAGITLHVVVHRGKDAHHVVEAAFKALALALADATRPRAELLSTKGEVALTKGAD